MKNPLLLIILFLFTLSHSYGQNAFYNVIESEDEDLKRAVKEAGLPEFAPGFVGSSASFVSPKVQTSVIDGTAKFIAERFKNEATELYINKFLEKLEKVPELQQLLPKTYKYLKGANYFNYSELGNDLKTVFEEDLENLLGNIKPFVEENRLIKNSKVNKALVFGLSVGEKLIDNYNPIEILDYLELEFTGKAGYEEYERLVKVVSAIQHNLRARNDGFNAESQKIWVGFSELKKLLSSPTLLTEFTNLLNSSSGESFTEEEIKQLVTGLGQLFSTIDNFQSQEYLDANDYTQIFRSVFQFFEIAQSVIEEPSSADFKKIKDVFESVNDIYISIKSKDYATIVTLSLGIIKDIVEANPDTSLSPKTLTILNNLSKYGAFMTGIVKAENSDAVKEVISKYVLPSGSYLKKRRSLSSLTLTAHPGIVGGWEKLTDAGAGNDGFEPNLGITAPIGFELVWGIRKRNPSPKDQMSMIANNQDKLKGMRGSYLGLFLSIADIGAVFNYRLNDSESELADNITFKEIFAPGAMVHYGFKNSPITLGAGVQYTPKLREVMDPADGANRIESNSLRVQATLTWDIPLINFFTRDSKPKK